MSHAKNGGCVDIYIYINITAHLTSGFIGFEFRGRGYCAVTLAVAEERLQDGGCRCGCGCDVPNKKN